MDEEMEALMQRALRRALEWKGRALAAAPAMKVALSALQSVHFLQCPWCGDSLEHQPGCLREVAIKVLTDALK